MTGESPRQKPRVSILVAMAKNGVIGGHNKLPWHLSSDLKRFKALTMGHHIIMGRKTFESIGRLLPGRTSVVISRNPGFRFDGILVADSLGKALALAADDSEVFVIGGEQIFREALGIADRILLTEIHREFEGDTFFPAIEPSTWKQVSRDAVHDPELSATFTVLERR